MIQESRIDLYDYLYGLFHNVVSKNVYKMGEPMETTKSDVEDGFLLIRVGNMMDESEFSCECLINVRCYVIAYVPKKSRGRLDSDKYKAFESGINRVVRNEIKNGTNLSYFIVPDSVLSMDDDETTEKGNQYHLYIKSFVVGMDDNINE